MDIILSLVYWIYTYILKNFLLFFWYVGFMKCTSIHVYVLIYSNLLHFILKLFLIYILVVLKQYMWFWFLNFNWILTGIFWAMVNIFWASWWYGENVEENTYLLTLIYILGLVHFRNMYKRDNIFFFIYINFNNLYLYIRSKIKVFVFNKTSGYFFL